jgi:serine/threonine protein kinase
MDPNAPESLFAALRECGLYPAVQLAAIPDAAAAGPDPGALSEALHARGLLTPYQSRKVRFNRISEIVVGKYLVLDKVGEGGMGKVYKAVECGTGKVVALKVVRAHLMQNKTIRGRYHREVAAAAALKHPNIVTLLDDGEANGRYYLAMEFVDGSDLSRMVKEFGKLPYQEAAEYVRQAALGLQHAHEQGLIHRDIKPSNLLLDRAGVVKILDLGLARFTGDDQDNVTRQFSGHTVLGTADYLSPEQALMADRIDIRADVYSLGATFYFLLTGRAPFEEATVPQKLLAHQLREPAPPAGAPDDLAAVIRRMMQKHPAARYQHPAEVIDALAGWLTEEIPPPDEAWFPRKGSVGGAGSTAPNGPRTAPPPSGRTAQRSGVGITGRTPLPKTGSLTKLPPAASVPAAQSNVLPRPDEPPRSRKWLYAGIAAAVLALIGVVLVIARV